MIRIFSPCKSCGYPNGTGCPKKCLTFMDWEERGYWEDYQDEPEDEDEREEAFTVQERNPGFRSW